MRQQSIRNFTPGQTASFYPFPRVLRSLFDQLAGAREIVRRGVEGAQTGYGENIDFPDELPQITHHLMSDKQCDRMQGSRDCSLRRLVEGASKSCWESDNTGGAEIGCGDYRRVAPDGAINEIMFADAYRWERCRDGGAGENRFDRGAR